MSAPFSTLLLDTVAWDLVIDSNANIAVASPPYSLAQDVASAVRTFLGECYFDNSQGVPYLQEILGKSPPLTVFDAAIVAAALSVPGVQSAVCIIDSFNNRTVTGQVQFVDTNGVTGSIPL